MSLAEARCRSIKPMTAGTAVSPQMARTLLTELAARGFDSRDVLRRIIDPTEEIEGTKRAFSYGYDVAGRLKARLGRRLRTRSRLLSERSCK